jgi:hypothetical protein
MHYLDQHLQERRAAIPYIATVAEDSDSRTWMNRDDYQTLKMNRNNGTDTRSEGRLSANNKVNAPRTELVLVSNS